MDQGVSRTDLPLLSEPWFAVSEYHARLAAVQEVLVERGLGGLLLFQPESVTWLTGFFTRGYASFQCVLVPAKGEPVTCCRDMEAYYFEKTGVFPERRFWSDTDNPAEIAGTLIASYFPSAGRIAIELKAWPLSVDRHSKITSLLAGRELVDGSDIVARLRQRKSPAEIYLMRQAAKAAEAGMAKAEATAAAGITERAMAASISSALIEAGSDMQGPGVLASGERALHLHGSYTDKRIEAGETLQFEVLACVRHYHARFMRTIKIEYASDTEKVLAEQLISIQDAALAEVGPGVAATVPDRIYREGVLSRGLAERYSNKTFYGVGLLLPPSGGEGLEASPAALWSFEPGMTLHSYLLAQGFGFSETILITETGYERLTNYPRELILAAAAG